MQMHVDTAPTAFASPSHSVPARADWGAVALAVLCVATLYGAAHAIQHAHGALRQGELAVTVLGYGLALSPLLVIMAVCRRLEPSVSFLDLLALRRPVDPSHTVWRAVGVSSVGIVLVVVITAMLLLEPAAQSSGFARFAGAYAGGSLASALLLAVVAPLCEECVFRGYLHGRLERAVGGIAVPVIVTSVVFMAMHMPATTQYAATLLGMGVVLSVLRVRCGSVLPGIVLHGVWNAMICALAAMAAMG